MQIRHNSPSLEGDAAMMSLRMDGAEVKAPCVWLRNRSSSPALQAPSEADSPWSADSASDSDPPRHRSFSPRLTASGSTSLLGLRLANGRCRSGETPGSARRLFPCPSAGICEGCLCPSPCGRPFGLATSQEMDGAAAPRVLETGSAQVAGFAADPGPLELAAWIRADWLGRRASSWAPPCRRSRGEERPSELERGRVDEGYEGVRPPPHLDLGSEPERVAGPAWPFGLTCCSGGPEEEIAVPGWENERGIEASEERSRAARCSSGHLPTCRPSWTPSTSAWRRSA